MAIAKFDLYKPEWLELVFDNRNKDYGAYDLRKHYNGNLVKAMVITFFSVGVAITIFSILHKSKIVTGIIPDVTIKVVPVVLNPNLQPLKPVTPIKHPSAPTIRSLPMVVAPDPVASKPVTIDEYNNKAIGQVTTTGKDDGEIVIPGVSQGTGSAPVAKADNTPVDVGVLEVMPEPYGGASAWAKFLQKNIHYPVKASENGIQGKVFLSFIVETDGHLSNITVERGVGYGLDEEAARVLKLAPSWKPGIQNGHKVRVKYNIPISFLMPDSE
jgi:protein TonB